MAEYFTSDLEHPISEDALREAAPDVQRDAMLAWFRQRFEDPAERTPYESAEGGYIWIWGGPYDAREELEEEFTEIVPEEIIDEVTSDLEAECTEWAPTPDPSDFDQQLAAALGTISGYYKNFTDAILDIERLLETKVEASVAPCFRRLLFVNVITALETYLSDAFTSTVLNSSELLRRFIETTPEFKAEKFAFSDVFSAAESAQRKARAHLFDVVWHHIERIKPMYRDTLGIDFPTGLSAIFKAILIRHDIVHRNGKTRNGEEVVLNSEDVTNLIEAVENFVQHIDTQLHERTAARSNQARGTAISALDADTSPPDTEADRRRDAAVGRVDAPTILREADNGS